MKKLEKIIINNNNGAKLEGDKPIPRITELELECPVPSTLTGYMLKQLPPHRNLTGRTAVYMATLGATDVRRWTDKDYPGDYIISYSWKASSPVRFGSLEDSYVLSFRVSPRPEGKDRIVEVEFSLV